MDWVSIIAIIILILSFLGGMKDGAVKTFSSLVALIIAIPLAGLSYRLIAPHKKGALRPLQWLSSISSPILAYYPNNLIGFPLSSQYILYGHNTISSIFRPTNSITPLARSMASSASSGSSKYREGILPGRLSG